MPRPRTYASEHPAVHECSTVCRDAQVEERAEDLRMCQVNVGTFLRWKSPTVCFLLIKIKFVVFFDERMTT